MKSTGIVRPVDSLGRVVLPVELRRALGIEYKDLIEIHVEGNSIILRKQTDSCAICGGKGTIDVGDKKICSRCLKTIKAIDK